MTPSLPLPVLRQLLNEATPGWNIVGGTHDRQVVDDRGAFVCETYLVRDAALIVAAVNHLPALLDLVERQAAAIEAVQAVVEKLHDEADANDETLRMSSPTPPWRDKHLGLRNAYRHAADQLTDALSGITPTTEENPK